MRWRGLLFLVLFLPAACTGNVEKIPAQAESRLYVYRSEPSRLLRFSGDLSQVEGEISLALPADCALNGLYPSPQGLRLAAEVMCEYGPVTVLADMTNGSTLPVIQQPNVDSHFLGWAADGEFLYVRAGSMTEPRILRVDTGSLRAAEMPIDPYTYDLAASTQEGRILFSFSHGMGFGSELWSAQENGRGARRLLADEASIIAFVRPSPADGRVAFIKIPDSETAYTTGELWVLDERSGEGKMLAEADAGHGFAAAWSPDGSRIAFVLRSNPQDREADSLVEALKSNIAVVEVETGGITMVTHFEDGRATSPVWSPDGNTLAFAYVLDGRMDMLIADPTGRQAETVVLEEACCPAWMRK